MTTNPTEAIEPDKPLTEAELAEIERDLNSASTGAWSWIGANAERLFASHRLRDAEVAALTSKVYQPGVFKCAKCNFQLVQKTLNAHDGSVTARDAVGEKCPNDGSPMWRVSYQEDNAKAWKWGEEQFDRARDADAEASLLRGEVERLQGVLTFYANRHSWRSSSLYMCGHIGQTMASVDGGDKARAALSGEGQ